MRLSLQGLASPEWAQNGYLLPAFDVQAMRRRTLDNPRWAHFGAGNILRAFPAVLCQKLLESGDMDSGISVVECYDEEIIDRAFAPYDNLTLAVSLKSDGRLEKRVVASIAEALGYQSSFERVKNLMVSPSLQMVSMTITEKGYAVTDAQGEPLPFCKQDFESMEAPVSIIGKMVKLLHMRYRAGAHPVAMVSMDNCSHNGTILRTAMLAVAGSLCARGLVEKDFLDYLRDESRVSFPWSMIDKITPRPSQDVIDLLGREGFEGAEVVKTARNTFVSAMVNAEECEYLAIEDRFPAGRPPLEKTGVIFCDRHTVDRIEKMKVCTCLNPLHTCLAVFGCMMGYRRIADEMKDAALTGFIRQVGYAEGLPVVVDPGVMDAKRFIDEVVNLRLPNPFMPDTPQRIACDTSKKIPVRFGETLKAYLARGERDLSFLTFIPLLFAGYARYLTGIGDDGAPFELSPDPNLERLTALMRGFRLGQPFDQERLHALFSDAEIFGVNLYEVRLGEKAETLFARMGASKGAIRATLESLLAEQG